MIFLLALVIGIGLASACGSDRPAAFEDAIAIGAALLVIMALP